MVNPRWANGSLRRKNRQRMKAMQLPCGICHGKFGPIHYEEPSDHNHPFSFVIDEIKPVSRWKEFGYSSKREAAEDWNNLQASHYICNQYKSNRTDEELKNIIMHQTGARKLKINASDGDW